MASRTHLARVLQVALPDVFAMLPVDAAITGSILTSRKEYAVFPTGEQSHAVFPHLWNGKEQHFQAGVEDELKVAWNGWLLYTKLGAKPPVKSGFTREALPFHLLLGFRFLMFYCVRIIIQLHVWHRY